MTDEIKFPNIYLQDYEKLIEEFPGVKNELDKLLDRYKTQGFDGDSFSKWIKKPITRKVVFINPDYKQEENIKVHSKFQKVSLLQYKNKLHEWFYFTDDEIIDIQLATLIGEKIPGDPLWMFIIAPPGALKTETLRSFTLCNDFFPLSDLTSKTFVSGLMLGKGEKRKKIEDLLPQLNGKVLIFKDFTTILEKNSDERAEIFAQLREIYDGSFSKKFGTIDETIRYNSRFGFIAGVTPIIDKHWKLMQQLGERFLKTRWEENIDLVTTRARENEGKEKEMRLEMEKYAMGFITNINFSEIPDFNDDLYGHVLDMIAKFIAIARTPVSIQDYRTDFYFDYIPTPERPTRLVKQLKKLSKCLAIVRGKNKVDNQEILTLLRVAKDTIPQDRLKILEVIHENQSKEIYGCPRPLIMQKLKMPEQSTQRVLEQLKMLDLISTQKLEESVGTYIKQTYYHKISPFVAKVLTPPTFTVVPQISQQGKTEDIINENIDKTPIKPENIIDFNEIDTEFKHE